MCNIYKLAFHRLGFVLIFEGRLELRKLVSTDQSKFAHSLPSPSHCPSDSLNLFSRLFTYFEMFVIQYATSCLSMNIQFAFRAALVSHIRKKCIKKRTTNSPQARDQWTYICPSPNRHSRLRLFGNLWMISLAVPIRCWLAQWPPIGSAQVPESYSWASLPQP